MTRKRVFLKVYGLNLLKFSCRDRRFLIPAIFIGKPHPGRRRVYGILFWRQYSADAIMKKIEKISGTGGERDEEGKETADQK